MRYCSKNMDPEIFDRVKRRKRQRWHFLLSGEWSQSPYHQGDLTFYYSFNTKKNHCAILQTGYPKRIVAIVDQIKKESDTYVLAYLLYMLKKKDDIYVDYLHDYCKEPIHYDQIEDILLNIK